jgi:hypothetical protein
MPVDLVMVVIYIFTSKDANLHASNNTSGSLHIECYVENTDSSYVSPKVKTYILDITMNVTIFKYEYENHGVMASWRAD